MIEVKRRLNRVVLGQVIIVADFMEMEYGLRPDQIRQVVIVEIGDPALEELCRRRGIEVCFGTKWDYAEIEIVGRLVDP